MKHIVYVVVTDTYLDPEETNPMTSIDSVWDVFEHADERTDELKDDYTHARIEAIPLNDAKGGRVCRSRTCPECEAPVIARMVTDEDRASGPGYECSSCDHSWRI